MAQTEMTPKEVKKESRRNGRIKRKAKLAASPEVAKAFFDAKSKRSAAKKLAYRRRHAKKA